LPERPGPEGSGTERPGPGRAGGPWLGAWTAAGYALSPLAAPLLRRRLARGKEDPARWREKLGEPTLPRPEGRLAWLHAVGLGEVLALRGLIAEMADHAPDLSFLVTSTARSSALAAMRNLPPRTLHQFLPLDLPGPRRRFLDHWRPDLSVWAEQDLWPGLIADTAARGIPLALVNARMNAEAYRRRLPMRGLYGPLLSAFDLIAAQDARTARNLEALGAPAPVPVTGSLKPAAPPLADDPATRADFENALGPRPLWLAASTHAEDETVALTAHRAIAEGAPEVLLLLVPRQPARGPEIAEAAHAAGLVPALRSEGRLPNPDTQVYIADTIGELGLWYRLAPAALIGGSFGPVNGHNPWEPARLGCAILHGPNTANFAADYAALHAAGAARLVRAAPEIAAALADPALPRRAETARALADTHAAGVRDLARDLVGLMAP
jgi:3-deoxy-D-manno-octulosonic-acid transferase